MALNWLPSPCYPVSTIARPFIFMYHTTFTRSTAPTIANNNANDGHTPSTATSAGGDELTLGNLLLQQLPLVPVLILTIEIIPFTARVTLLVTAPYHFRHFFHYLTNCGSSLLNQPWSHTSSTMQLGCLLPTTYIPYLLPFPSFLTRFK
jgi:hypothetical protein